MIFLYPRSRSKPKINLNLHCLNLISKLNLSTGKPSSRETILRTLFLVAVPAASLVAMMFDSGLKSEHNPFDGPTHTTNQHSILNLTSLRSNSRTNGFHRTPNLVIINAQWHPLWCVQRSIRSSRTNLMLDMLWVCNWWLKSGPNQHSFLRLIRSTILKFRQNSRHHYGFP